MKLKFILCFALVLSAGLFAGCSVERHIAGANGSPSDLYLHLYASYLYPKPPWLIVSTAVKLGNDFDVSMADGDRLKGRVESRNGKYFVHFQGRLCSGPNIFDGAVELEKRYEPWPQPYDDKAPFVCQPHFVLSTNPSPQPFLKQQADAERKVWQRENPLTARQLAEVDQKFRLMRPGLTKDEVFALLGLSAYQNYPFPSNPFGCRFDKGDYQLGEGKRLLLYFDNTGLKTTNAGLPVWDQMGDTSQRLVIRAELDSLICPSNGPPVWQTTARWP